MGYLYSGNAAFRIQITEGGREDAIGRAVRWNCHASSRRIVRLLKPTNDIQRNGATLDTIPVSYIYFRKDCEQPSVIPNSESPHVRRATSEATLATAEVTVNSYFFATD